MGDTEPVHESYFEETLTVKSNEMTALCFPTKMCISIFGLSLGRAMLKHHVLSAINDNQFL
jgi:hypothetical protein